MKSFMIFAVAANGKQNKEIKMKLLQYFSTRTKLHTAGCKYLPWWFDPL